MNEIVNVEPATLQWHGDADGHLNILDQTLLRWPSASPCH